MNQLTVRLSSASRDDAMGVEGAGMELDTRLMGADLNCNDIDDLTPNDYVTISDN